MIASLSLDLDNHWSYLKGLGDPSWETYPSYLPKLVPRILKVLRDANLKITFFVVGRDAEQPQHQDLLRSIAEDGHEIANHSFHHETWLHLYSREQLVEEFERSEEAIRSATGVQVCGFRGPGFSFSPLVQTLLAERGYEYDATSFPSFIGPVARLYLFLAAGLQKKDREKRKHLFGSWTAGFRTMRPHWLPGTSVVELPVTTFPWLKIPIHFSYIVSLAQYSPWLARTYFKTALRCVQIHRIEPSILLHPLEFLGGDEEDSLNALPGMRVAAAQKLALMTDLLGWMSQQFQCVTTREHAVQFANRTARK